MRETPRVALLIETSRGFGRQFLGGVARYSELHGPWNFFIRPGDFEQVLPHMHKWGGAGIIARIANERVARAVEEAGLPTIVLGTSEGQIGSEESPARFSEVGSNAEEVAQLAVDHLRDRRFAHFAYVGLEGRIWSQRREREFTRLLAELGTAPFVHKESKSDSGWDKEQFILAKWLKRLPKPIGIFACNDDRGREVLEACRIAELRVPDEVAVLGVDNDEVFCGLAYPPLSSIALNADSAGFRAAELLDSMMRGKVCEPKRIEVEAIGVVTRRSTDIVAVDDEDVARALRYIHGKKGYKITVDDVVREALVSRRYLEKKFKVTLERTILDEIQKAKLEKAKDLLLETSLPISRVAKLAGFGTTGYFIDFFQKRLGRTPRKFRNEMNN